MATNFNQSLSLSLATGSQDLVSQTTHLSISLLEMKGKLDDKQVQILSPCTSTSPLILPPIPSPSPSDSAIISYEKKPSQDGRISPERLNPHIQRAGLFQSLSTQQKVASFVSESFYAYINSSSFTSWSTNDSQGKLYQSNDAKVIIQYGNQSGIQMILQPTNSSPTTGAYKSVYPCLYCTSRDNSEEEEIKSELDVVIQVSDPEKSKNLMKKGYEILEGLIALGAEYFPELPKVIHLVDGRMTYIQKKYPGELAGVCQSNQLKLDDGQVKNIGIQEYLEIFLSMGEALFIMHAHDWIHGDLKPNNIFVTFVNGLWRGLPFDYDMTGHAGISQYEGTVGFVDYLFGTEHILTPFTDAFAFARTIESTLLKQLMPSMNNVYSDDTLFELKKKQCICYFIQDELVKQNVITPRTTRALNLALANQSISIDNLLERLVIGSEIEGFDSKYVKPLREKIRYLQFSLEMSRKAFFINSEIENLCRVNPNMKLEEKIKIGRDKGKKFMAEYTQKLQQLSSKSNCTSPSNAQQDTK